MNAEELREFALSFKDTEEAMPFGPDIVVFKKSGKIFLLVSLESIPLQINVKCDPEKAVLLRDEFSSVLPGYHMNKKHWNTIILDGTIQTALVKEWIKESYALVFPGVRKS